TTTADPLEDPPGTRVGSIGFSGGASWTFSPFANQHSSLSAVLPTITPPDARTAATHAASIAAGPDLVAATAGEPTSVGQPATSIASFTATRGPAPTGLSILMTHPSMLTGVTFSGVVHPPMGESRAAYPSNVTSAT